MNTSQAIPGPKGLPLLGNILDFAKDPLAYLVGLMRDYGDIVSFGMVGGEHLLLSDPDAIAEVLVKQAGKFEKAERDRKLMGRALGKGLVTNEGESHKRQRMLSQPSFRKKRIPIYAKAMIEETGKMLSRWKEEEEVDLTHEMMRLTMYIVSRALFDLDVGDMADALGEAVDVQQELAKKSFRSPVLLPGWIPTPGNLKHRKAKRFVDAFLMEQIEERRKEEAEGTLQDRGDLFSSLLIAEDEDGNRMDDRQLLDELITLFVAGHETTANALSWTFYMLSQHPQVEQKLQQELQDVLAEQQITPEHIPLLPYTQMVLKESMRLYPPAWTLNVRTAQEDVQLGDQLVKKGTHIFIAPYVLHRNPALFPDPERFDPERFSPEQEKERNRYAYIPFGAGPRVCIGNGFAMMEATLLLAQIVQHTHLELLPGQIIKPTAQITMSPEFGLKMRLHPRNPLPLNPTQHTPNNAKKPAPSLANQPSGCPFHPA